MNHIIIAGNLGADPEVRFTSSGQKVTTFRVATKARKGETIWWRVTVWGEQFDKMISYLKKGSSVVVMGELSKPEIFTDREGKPQVSMNITASSLQFSPFGKPDAQAASPVSSIPVQAEPEMAFAAQESVQGQGKMEFPAFTDEDIPF
jgi:single-strand DNA-binding protein